MMRGAAAWTAGLAGSALAHLGAGGLFLAIYDPQPPPDQMAGRSSVVMDTVTAPTQDAEAREVSGQPAAEAQGNPASVAAGSVPQARARPVAAPGEPVAPVTPSAPSVTGTPATGARAQGVVPQAQPLTAARVTANTVPDRAMEAVSARVQAPTAETAAALSPEAETARNKAPAPEIAAALPPVADPVAPALPRADARLSATDATAVTLADSAPNAESVRSQPPTAETAAVVSPAAEAARSETPAPVVVAALAPVAEPAAPALPPAEDAQPSPATAAPALQRVEPATEPVTSITPTAEPATPAPAAGVVATAQATAGELAASQEPKAETARLSELPAQEGTATPAWQFGDRLVTDPQALETIQAFMAPEAIDDAAEVRDDLSAVLGRVECARLSATFIPEDGVLELRGHIPDPDLQEPLLAAMRAQVGEGIPVTANLLHLPAPQCGALSGIAAAGLPQSVDQFTNARLIGENAHARDYRFTEGQRLQFDLSAPDYDAFVYVDYFTADGEVIHLVPNDIIPLTRHDAKSFVGIGTDSPGRPGLRLTIGPPYGQEIAVAFAASHPLYEDLRPTIEPAEGYLAFLKKRIAALRAAHPDFRGEWVYFFITTAPATQ